MSSSAAVTATPFHTGLPVVDVQFIVAESGGTVWRRLLVDSGFVGASAFVLSTADGYVMAQDWAEEGQVSGALSGQQRHAWVSCLVPALGFQRLLMAICADLSPLKLPSGVHGLAGLTFLQQFAEWGGRRDPAGNWSFVLST